MEILVEILFPRANSHFNFDILKTIHLLVHPNRARKPFVLVRQIFENKDRFQYYFFGFRVMEKLLDFRE